MRKLIHAIPAGVPSAILTGIIAYLTLANHPIGEDVPLFEGADKVVHFIMYFALTLTLYYDCAKKKYPHHLTTNCDFLLCSIAMLMGLVFEVGQLATKVRCFYYRDIVANCLGALAAGALQHFWLMHYMRKFIRHNRPQYRYRHHRRHRHRK